MATRPATERGRLGKLPMELQLVVFEALDYGAAIMLASVNRYFHSMIDPDTLVPIERKLAFLREAEFFDQHCSGETVQALMMAHNSTPRNPLADTAGFGLACVECLRIKKWHCFAYRNSILAFGLYKPKSLLKAGDYKPKRICSDCAAKPQVFAHGDKAGPDLISSAFADPPEWFCTICIDTKDFESASTIRGRHGCPECGLCVRITADDDKLICPICFGKLMLELGTNLLE